MRIAVTGTHGSGKTTLIDDFVSARPDYESVPEPYWLLAQEGVPFADGPNSADLEEQLRQSCNLILDHAGEGNLIFDRCPLDFLAYLDVVSHGEGFEWVPDGKLLTRIGRALATLDWLVFVPLLPVDEIEAPIEYPQLRARVDRRLKAMLRQDEMGLLATGPRLLEVSGSREARVAQIAAALR
ncbi:hypothetical protein C3941_18800 [Kaistia algarum]|uniref:AAA family ATPase n=1 Tax=Kaistia algarum TaxID=2083279 RepID=UPI000CE80EA8|nr:AAA family ATPase [Kaistia algarum]MCX5516507.1 AAA family ATPase [Kaistia algarum]PPE78377.1 hypothetical protein C3941_18800 [Kaistia algarum]